MKDLSEKKEKFVGVRVERELYERLYKKTSREISLSDLLRSGALLLLSKLEQDTELIKQVS